MLKHHEIKLHFFLLMKITFCLQLQFGHFLCGGPNLFFLSRSRFCLDPDPEKKFDQDTDPDRRDPDPKQCFSLAKTTIFQLSICNLSMPFPLPDISLPP